MNILGLDIATKCGIVLYNTKRGVLYAETLTHPPQKDRYNRWGLYLDPIYDLMEDQGVAYAVIEGYGFARVQHIVPLVELGTLIRMALNTNQVPWVEVAPTSLKKFAIGKGNAKKSEMLLSVYKRWKYEANDDNIADAYALARLGEAVYGKVKGLPKYSQEVVKLVSDKFEDAHE